MPTIARPRPPHPAIYAHASARRAELFSALNRLSLIRKHGPRPWDRALRQMDVDTVRAANKVAGSVLP